MEDKEILPAKVFAGLTDALKARAGRLANVWNTLFTGEIYTSLYESIRDGRTVLEFAQEAQSILDRYGASEGLRVYTGDRFSPAYADVVFRTNTAAAYAAGRYSEMFNPDYMAVAPYWQYQSVDDERTRPEHRALDGKVFRKDDAASRHWLPPWDFNCRCVAVEKMQEEVDAEGLRVTSGSDIAKIPLKDEDGNPLRDKDGNLMTVGRPPEGWDADRVDALVPHALQTGVPQSLAAPRQRDAHGRFASGSSIDVDVNGRGKVGEDGSYAGLSGKEWGEWVDRGWDVKTATTGESKAGDEDVGGSVRSAKDIARDKAIGDKVQAAAESNAVEALALYRGEAYEDEDSFRAAYGGKRSVVLNGPTATAIGLDLAHNYSSNYAQGFDPSKAVEITVEFQSGTRKMMGVQPAYEGSLVGEVVLPIGAKYSVSSIDRNYFGERHHRVRLYTPGKIPKDIPVANVVDFEWKKAALHALAAAPLRDYRGRFAAKGMVAAERGEGRRLTGPGGAALPDHIAKMRVPPAWEDVHYHPDPAADLQVVGRAVKEDGSSKVQYLYSERHSSDAAAAKFARNQEMQDKANSIEKQNAKDLSSSDEKTRQNAEVLHVVMQSGIRPGSETDTGAARQAYGATTLRKEHVHVDADGNVRLKFVGKHGVDLDIPVTEPVAARILKARRDAADDGAQLWPKVSDSTLRDRVHEMDGGGFKTKDFRTHRGTGVAMKEVSKMPAPKTEKEYNVAVLAVAKSVAKALGNTHQVALKSYINPAVFAPWRAKLGGLDD